MPTLRPITEADVNDVLALNERNVVKLAPMDEARLHELSALADRFDVVDVDGAFAGLRDHVRARARRTTRRTTAGSRERLRRGLLLPRPDRAARGLPAARPRRLRVRRDRDGRRAVRPAVPRGEPRPAATTRRWRSTTAAGYKEVGRLGDEGHLVVADGEAAVTPRPSEVARRSAREAMWAEDRASRALGMELVEVAPGRATLSMTVREDMVNGHAHRARRPHVHARRLGVRVRLQLLQPAHGRGGVRDPLPGADPARRRAGRRGGGAQPRGPRRRLRHHVRVGDAVVAEFVGRSKEIRGTLFDDGGDVMGRPVRSPTSDARGARALQLERLRETLRAPTSTCRTTGAPSTTAGVAPDDLTSLADLARFPFTTKADLRENYPFGMFAVPREQVRRVHASSGTTGKPTVVGYTARRPRHLGRADGALDPGRRRTARRPRARGLRLRAVHRRARCALRRRAARLHGGPGQRRHDRAAGAADRRLRAAGDHGDPVVLPGDPRRDRGARASTRGAPASRSASSAPSRGPTRCGARSRRGPASRPSTSTGSRR